MNDIIDIPGTFAETMATIAETEPLETIVETVAETVAQVMTPAPTEAVTEVIEVVETIDYTDILTNILGSAQNVEYCLQLLSGFALFAVVVCLCYFCYKFFRIFI